MNVDLKDIPPYVHDGFVVRHRDDYNLIHPLLKQNGFCIVENVLSPEKCADFKNMFKTYLREASSGFDVPLNVDDPTTWKTYKQFYPANGMMMKHFHFCDSEVVWSVRQDENVVGLWSFLYDTAPEDMLVSFDGGSYLPALEHDPSRKRYPPKREFQYHIDTDLVYQADVPRDFDPRFPYLENEKGYRGTIQGVVLLEDTEEGDSTLDCIKGSHLYHYEFCQRFAQTVKTPKKEWQKMTKEMVQFYLEKPNVERVRLTAKKDSVFLFTSQTLHNVCQPVYPRTNPKDRFVVYVCYVPRQRANEKQLEKKRKAFHDRVGTSHNPAKISRNSEFPHTWGKKLHTSLEDVVISAPKMTPLGMKLAGF